jgi:hypothetical protein
MNALRAELAESLGLRRPGDMVRRQTAAEIGKKL